MAVAEPPLGAFKGDYQGYGAAAELWRCKDAEVLLSGPAGTGKSRACLEKLYACAVKYPGMRGLILRKTRAALSEAALQTFEEKVLPQGSSLASGPSRATRKKYTLANGSEINIGGFDLAKADTTARIMSTEYDLIYIQEAIECDERDWENATSRLRNGVLPYQQLIADTNPDAPQHWLKQRCNRGQTRLVESRHEDNPTVTADYLAKLDALTGVRYKRLRLGLWVAAEGQVYEGWDPAIHRVDRFEIPPSWPRYWVADFGFTNPFCWQAWAEDPDGRLFRYREIYQTQRLVEDHARQILVVTQGEPAPEAVICDHDAEDRATLGRYLQMQTTAATKLVSPGIQAVALRLRDAGDGRARLFYLRDSLVERDPALAEKKFPVGTEEEYESYVWDLANNRKHGEEPLKQHDHGMDATRYLVAFIDGVGPRWVPWTGLGETRDF
jgi:phage terminase large subunit